MSEGALVAQELAQHMSYWYSTHRIPRIAQISSARLYLTACPQPSKNGVTLQYAGQSTQKKSRNRWGAQW